MNDARNRHARNHDSRRVLGTGRRATRLRRAAALASLAAMVLGAGSAQALTGGAASYTYESTTPEGQELAFGTTRYGGASWYGPGLYGNSTACGVTLRPTTVGVAHKTLPCGTMVKFIYQGNTVVAPVIDRGPYVDGRSWDLTSAAKDALDFEGVGRVRYAIARSFARPILGS